jgi:hypothetical protein
VAVPRNGKGFVMCNEQGIYGYHVQTIHKETGEVVNSWFSKEWEGPLQAAPHSIKGFETIATPVYLAPPTYTAIAAMVIEQAAEIVAKHEDVTWDLAMNEILALTPANAEAELEALMMKVAELSHKCGVQEGIDVENWGRHEIRPADLRAIVRRVLDEKGE